MNYVTPGFFTTTGMRVREGRDFLPHERNREDVVVVNETMAEHYWPGQSPVGQCLYLGRNPACRTVIGVVADARRFNLIEEERYVYFYRPLPITDTSSRSLLVRAAPGADGMDDVLQQVMQDIDPDVPFIQIETMGQALDPQIRPWRLGASVFTAFGILAVLLAVIGLSSSIGYAVSQRTHEFAVRLAIGADPRMLITLMLKTGVWNALAATAIGLGTAALAGSFIADLLYETSPYDPLVFVAVAVIVIVTATIASLIPAWRVARIDPALALRSD
jgi:predicted lysophospholipase L1 biosynthesis ABC-type transport system permease subunit